MDNPKERSKSAAAKADNLISENPIGEAYERFANAQNNLSQSQQDLQQKSQQMLAGPSQAYGEAMQKLRDDVMKRTEKSYRQFAQVVKDAGEKDDAQKLLEGAYRAYAEEIQSVAKEVQDRSTEAYRSYTTALTDAQAESRKQYADAYRAYLRSMQDAWANVNVDAIADLVAKGNGG